MGGRCRRLLNRFGMTTPYLRSERVAPALPAERPYRQTETQAGCSLYQASRRPPRLNSAVRRVTLASVKLRRIKKEQRTNLTRCRPHWPHPKRSFSSPASRFQVSESIAHRLCRGPQCGCKSEQCSFGNVTARRVAHRRYPLYGFVISLTGG